MGRADVGRDSGARRRTSYGKAGRVMAAAGLFAAVFAALYAAHQEISPGMSAGCLPPP